MAVVILGLGSNMGDRIGHISQAIICISNFLQIERISAPYETAPMYLLEQPPFINAALAGITNFGPLKLLEQIKELELQIGRQTREKNGPREIDIDLLAYGAIEIRSSGDQIRPLQVPHPLTSERRFVLEPLHEIAPNFFIPGFGAVTKLLDSIKGQPESVVKLQHATFSLHSN